MAILEGCLGCGWCAYCCPADVIYVASVGDEFKDIYLDMDSCICCGLCVSECPIDVLDYVISGYCGGSSGGGGGGGIGGGDIGGGDGGDIGGGDDSGGGGSGDWGGRPVLTLGAQIAEYAKRFPGKDIRRYGSGADTLVDCSQLTQEIGAAFDIKLPRTAAEQMNWYKNNNKFFTNIDSILPGDQLFYTNPNHTGIFVLDSLGNWSIIHATVNKHKRGCIKYCPIDSTGQIHNKDGSIVGFPNKFVGWGRH